MTVVEAPPAATAVNRLPLIGGSALAILLYTIFSVLVQVVFPPIGSLESHRVAADFADAWQHGHLDSLGYDPDSDPETAFDGNAVALNTAWMTAGIAGNDADHPTAVALDGEARPVDADTVDQPLQVSWLLDDGATWTYPTVARLHRRNDTWRVVWHPETVHPLLRHGLVMSSHRLLATRAPLRTVDGVALLPTVPTDPAAELVGRVVTASHELAEAATGHAIAGDQVGASGLQHLYDRRLGGSAGNEVDLITDPHYKPLQPVQTQLHVDPPQPGLPVTLTLRSTTQLAAERAVAGAATPAALVVVDPSTGAILADATGGTSSGRDLGLQAQLPPGSAFRPVAMLALKRHGIGPDNTALCSAISFEGQEFHNPASTAQTSKLSFADAFARDCPTAFAAEAAARLKGTDLGDAAADLGVTTSTDLGAPAFDGSIPVATTPLALAQSAFGEGQVLVSPLSLARMSATISSGSLRASSLVTNPAHDPAAVHSSLNGEERKLLTDLMSASVQQDTALAPLRALGGELSAVAGLAAYGPAADAPRTVWCTGFRNGVAFAAVVTPDPSGAAAGATGAGAKNGPAPTAAASVVATFLAALGG